MFEIKCTAKIAGETQEFNSDCDTKEEASEALAFMLLHMILLHESQGYVLIPVSQVMTPTNCRVELQTLCKSVTVVVSATKLDTQHLH